MQLAWFNRWLKGKSGSDEAPVKYFRMGGGRGDRTPEGKFQPGGEWRTSEQWPPAGVENRTFYLHAGGALELQKSDASTPTTYLFDPDHPVPTLGGRHGPACIQNQVISRSDVVSFVSPPLEDRMDVTGRISLSLTLSSERPDADFVAKLIDVYPNGYAMNVAERQIRASHDAPGKIYEMSIDLGSTSNLFEPGHRIRLDVSSSSFPKLEPLRQKARQSIHHDNAHPSRLALPVVRP